MGPVINVLGPRERERETGLNKLGKSTRKIRVASLRSTVDHHRNHRL